MADHPNAARSRKSFSALWEGGDPAPAMADLAEGVRWRNDIGAGPWRAVDGRLGVAAMLVWWTDFFEGTFRQELIDVCASDHRVVQVLREVGQREDRVFDNRALYVFELDADGRARAVTTFDRDRDAVEQFWNAFPDVLHLDVERTIDELAEPARQLVA